MAIFKIVGSNGVCYSDREEQKIIIENSDFFYKISNFQQLYSKMLDFVKKYQTIVHREIMRGA